MTLLTGGGLPRVPGVVRGPDLAGHGVLVPVTQRVLPQLRPASLAAARGKIFTAAGKYLLRLAPDEVLLGAGVVRVVGVGEVGVALLRGGLLLNVPQRVLEGAVMKTGR